MSEKISGRGLGAHLANVVRLHGEAHDHHRRHVSELAQANRDAQNAPPAPVESDESATKPTSET